jgi:subtilase family serine protease
MLFWGTRSTRNLWLAFFSAASLLVSFPFRSASAQVDSGQPSRVLIKQSIDESHRITLHGNTRPEARAENDRGIVSEDLNLTHMLLQLRRSPDLEESLQQFIDELHTPGSKNFHNWITAQEFGARFGTASQDLDKIVAWLESHGFRVNVVYPSGMLIDFSGTAGQVHRAFQTELHHLEVQGEMHIANVRDPSIPAALAPVIAGVVSLHDFRPQAMHRMRTGHANYTLGGNNDVLVPADLATIYNLNPLFSAGVSGQGQTIVLIEDTDVFKAADWTTFRSTFGLSSYTSASFTSIHPAPSHGTNNCGAPGIVAGNDAEAILDAEWASAAAPSAAIVMAACADTTTTFGGLIAMQNLLNAKSPPPALMSVSYGQCETQNGAAANASYNSAYQLAVTEGVSVFVAAGDSGAAGCDDGAMAATHGIGVNAFGSTPYNVSVGGTDFSDTFSNTNSAYWNSTNTSAFGSALSYIPEIPWNNSCAGSLLSQYEGYSTLYGPGSLCNALFIGALLQSTAAGGGGPSACATGAPSTSGVVSGTCKGWPKPSWQAVLGNPNDGVRDTPDVSLFAANGLWGHFYIFCWSDTANGGAACTGAPSGWSGAGGTSFASPIMAGIQALVNQKTGSRQGNPSPAYYQLAASEYGSNGNSSCNSTNGNTVSSSCIFYDVTQGDMEVNCTGTANCYLAGASSGVLSTSNNSYSPAYGTRTGWDFATGIGTVNATNLANNWPSTVSAPSFLLLASPGIVTVPQGTSGTSTVTITPQNGFNGSVSLSASGLPSGVTASFNPASATSTSTLTLTASGTATTGTVTATITGMSGSITSTTTMSLAVNPAPGTNFTLSASPSSLTILQGASGTSTVTITPQNGFNGSVSLSASGLPSGVTASFNPASATSASTLTLTASGTATTGTVTATITGMSGSVTNTTTISLIVQSVAVTTLPPGWTDADIGSTGVAGSAGYANGVFTVQGGGAQIYGTADAFNYVYQQLSGDGVITARLVSSQGGAGYASAGVMIRETLNANSTNAKTADWPAYHGIYFDVRTTTGGSTSEPASLGVTLPYWVKVSRSGGTFSSYVSSDGVNWVQLGTIQTIIMAQNVYVGLAVNSGGSTALATATFDNVSVNTVTPQPLPSGWLDQDIGSVGLAGSASYTNGTYTVTGAGSQIYGTADAFNYVYQQLSGDGTILARLVSSQGGSGYVSAGVMIRETLNANSTNAKTADWPAYHGIYFDVRTTTGGNTLEPANLGVTLPYWVKVSRSGNTFSSYVSSDGVNWVQLGTTQTIIMAQNVYVGLAVTSGSTSVYSTATFDNVSVTNP